MRDTRFFYETGTMGETLKAAAIFAHEDQTTVYAVRIDAGDDYINDCTYGCMSREQWAKHGGRVGVLRLVTCKG